MNTRASAVVNPLEQQQQFCPSSAGLRPSTDFKSYRRRVMHFPFYLLHYIGEERG